MQTDWRYTATLNWILTTLDIARLTNGSITSWIRSPKHNQDVGGHPRSQHLHGLALDMIHDTPQDKAAAFKLAQILGLYVLDESDHLHFQLVPPLDYSNAT